MYNYDLLTNLLDYFQINTLIEDDDKFSGDCVLHPYSDSGSFVIYKKNGYFKCYSHSCETQFTDNFNRPNIVGLTRGLLHAHNQDNSIAAAITLLNKLSQGKFSSGTNSANSFVSNFIKRARPQIYEPSTFTDHEILNHLSIPSKYFLTEGYDSSILIEKHAGDYVGDNRKLEGRAIVPIYENNKPVGYSARINVKNPCHCGRYHNLSMGCKQAKKDERLRQKWMHSKGLRKTNHLYNWDEAKKYVKETGNLYLVESPGNCWKLAECDIQPAATFGADISQQQINLILELGIINVRSINIIFDLDMAGMLGAEKVKNKLPRSLNINILNTTPFNDLGDMSKEQIKELINE